MNVNDFKFRLLGRMTHTYSQILDSGAVEKAKGFRSAMKMIEKLEPEKAEWVECDYKKLEHTEIETIQNGGFYCSHCNTGFKKGELRFLNYCPNCGFQMCVNFN